MAKSSETWVVTGASRGIGLEYVKQVRWATSLELQWLKILIARDQ
jgi:short-subunit dehydrogenase